MENFQLRWIIRRLLMLNAPGVLIGAVLMLLHMDLFEEKSKASFHLIEMFAGDRAVSRCARGAGYTVASMDIAYWNAWHAKKSKEKAENTRKKISSNPLDLLSASGFATALLAVLQGRPGQLAVVLAIVCASFVSICRATTQRSYLNPMGCAAVLGVQCGNLLASRMAIIIYLIEAMGGKYIVEQPGSSLLWRHFRLREIARLFAVWRQSFWMRIYGARTLKRTRIWSNVKIIRKLKTRKLTKQDRSSVKVALATVKVMPNGRKVYSGNKNLKSSQSYPLTFGFRVAQLLPEIFAAKPTPRTTRKVPSMKDFKIIDLLSFPEIFEISISPPHATHDDSPSHCDDVATEDPYPMVVDLEGDGDTGPALPEHPRRDQTEVSEPDVKNEESDESDLEDTGDDVGKKKGVDKAKAAMQAKLARICKPKSSSGTLDVPKEVYLKWKGKGKGREELLNTLIKCGGCKATFVKSVKHTYTSSRKGSFKVQGGFYSEKAMREDLKYDKPRIDAIKSYCKKNNQGNSHIRKDRYQSKLFYFWVDDVAIKGEFEKTEQEQLEEQTDLGTGTVDRVSLGLRDRRVDSLMLAVQGLGPGADDDSQDACSQASEDDDEHARPEKSKGAKNKQGKAEDLQLEDPDDVSATLNELLKEQSKLGDLCDKLDGATHPDAKVSCDNLRKRQKDMLKLHDDIAELKCDMDSQTKPPKESLTKMKEYLTQVEKTYLPKCHEDAEKMKNLFCGHWGFIDSPENTKCLIDWRDAPDSTRPTLANIKAGMRWLVEGAMPGDSLLFFYCGHGSQQRNVDRREKDGFDEVLVPVDGKTEGMLVDDEINEMLVQPLPAGVRLTCFLDSCHSGGGLDLPYQWNPYMEEGASWHLDEGGVYADADVICVSAAAEDQTAKGIPRLGNRENFPSGAFSASWCVACEVHETQCKMNWKEMLGIVKEVCDDFNWSQNVQLSSSQKFDLTREFNFHDCIPNSNDKKGPVVNDGMPGFPRRNRLMDPTFSGFKVP